MLNLFQQSTNMNTDTRSQVELHDKASSHYSTLPGILPEPVLVWHSVHSGHFYDVLKEWRTKQARSFGNPRRWKSFDHYKCSRGSGGGGPLRHTLRTFYYEPNIATGVTSGRVGLLGFNHLGSQTHPFGEPGMPIQGLPELGGGSGYFGIQIPEPTNLENLKAQSLKTMFPVIKAELSVVNSLLELKDFKSLPTTLANMRKIGSQAFRSLVAKKGSRKGTLRSLFRGGSDGYLQAQFNILPLLSDISGIHAALSRTERRINDFISRAGRVQTRHFAFNWNEHQNVNDTFGPHYIWRIGGVEDSIPAAWIMYNGISVNRYVQVFPSQFHAEMKYNYNYTSYQAEHAQLLGMLDAFGVNLNPSIIWNAIPWTFVIDWVAGIGPLLDRLKRTNMEPQINVLDYLWSIKRERRIQLETETVSLGISIPGASGSRSVHPAVTETSYRRVVERPDTSLLLQTSGLSSRELSLGAALVLSRRRRR